MKHLFIFSMLTGCCFLGFSQSNDSIKTNAIKLKLVGNPPSPRQNQFFSVGVDFSALKDSLYRSVLRQEPSLKVIPYYFNEQISIFSLKSLEVGKHEIGPLNFTYDNLKFTTNKLVFYVDDSIPVSDFGLWIRHSKTSDTTFCISIEQKVPIENPDNLTRLQLILRDSTGKACLRMVYLELKSGDFDLLEYTTSENGCSFQDFLVDSKKKYFRSYHNVACFQIKNRNVPIKFLKEHFKNIPDGYHFKPITIQ